MGAQTDHKMLEEKVPEQASECEPGSVDAKRTGGDSPPAAETDPREILVKADANEQDTDLGYKCKKSELHTSG